MSLAKGRYLNIAGLMSRKNDLFFEVSETTFNYNKAFLFMDKFVSQTVKKTVVILDNAPIYKLKKFMTKIEEWKKQDV